MATIEFPSNSDESKKRSPQTRKRPDKVAGAVVHKDSTMDRIVSAFKGGDDSQTVAGYILFEILIPAAKNMISDSVSQGIERLLFGSRRPSRSSVSSSYTDYHKVYSARYEPPRQEIQTRRYSNTDNIILESRDDADRVLEGLSLLIEQYGTASVADFYDLVGEESNYTDNKWGWTNLRDARVDRARNGFRLYLPRTESI